MITVPADATLVANAFRNVCPLQNQHPLPVLTPTQQFVKVHQALLNILDLAQDSRDRGANERDGLEETGFADEDVEEIGRASCRERV